MKDQNSRVLYAGYADKIEGRDNSWKLIADTEDARKKALEDGYTAFSTTSFDYEPEKGKPEPVRYGSLFLDFDYKSDPAMSIKAAREFINLLYAKCGVNLYSLRFWISGGKGCHVEIPAETFNCEAGHTYLPRIYYEFVKLLIEIHKMSSLEKILDLQMYNMGKGRLLRCENIKRPNGRYKVQVSTDEMLHSDVAQLLSMSDEPRINLPFVIDPPVGSSMMTKLFESAIFIFHQKNKNKHAKFGFDSLLNCGFIEYCWTNKETLSEPEWWAMVGVLMAFGDQAKPLVHLFSQGYAGYSEKETEDKINNWQAKKSTLSCSYLKKTIHDCGKNCNVGSPVFLWQRQHALDVQSSSAFSLEEDGVYYHPDQEGGGNKIFICSPLKVLGKLRSPESLDWSRLVELRAPDGVEKRVVVNMRDCVGRGDVVRAQLADYGVEFSNFPKAQALFMEYLRTSAPADKFLLRLNKVGWYGDTYVLPDALFGEHFGEEFYFESSLANLHNSSGSLDDWKEHVGKYCRDNSLLVLLTSYALTGPLLKPCGFEGGGIHIYGCSSAGKSTGAHVAGSVCGGGGNKGFMRQWNSTHNAIENTAVLHNDNMLVLDEIGQASAETVAQIPYMLANGQGKARMKADASARNIGRWLLNFLSNGELTINDKIQETGKFTSHVGQEVRVIDLPINAGVGQDLYENMHGYDNGARLSDDLVSNCMKYYGTPLRAFLAAFCGSSIEEKQRNIELIIEKAQKFVEENCPEGASGQVRRVARKFGLIASAGEFAHECGILPYRNGDARRAAEKWFKIWLQQRNCIGDREIAKVLKRVRDHFAIDSQSRYVPIEDADKDSRSKKAGFSWRDKVSGRKRFLMLSAAADEILKGIDRKVILEAMSKLGWLELKEGGSIRETKSIKGTNYRGYTFIPEAWEEGTEPDLKSSGDGYLSFLQNSN
jgi:uncharacterized protein (DUF927 family)